MRRKFNRLTSILIAVTIIFSLLPMNFAAAETTFPDFPTGWSKPAMEAAVSNGLISGYEDGTVRPKGNLTRAEMATIITKAFGAVTLADISALTDVKEGSWYYDSVSRAVKMGAIAGRSATEMAPNAAITRQEVFTILARVLVLSNEDTSSLNKFGDASEIASWAAPSMAALTERGYVNGDDLGNANPKDNITREEFAQLMYMAIRTYITERGTHTGNLDGITVIRVSGVTIKDANVTSDLVIGDGAGTGKVTIENVKVEKRLLVRGGAIAVIRDTELGENVVVNNVNGITYFDNYRDEPVFEGIVENTIAKFKERSPGGGSSGSGTTPTPPTGITLTYSALPYGATWVNQPTTSYPDGTTTITLPAVTDVNVLPGYELSGWTTNLTGLTVNPAGSSVAIPAGTTSVNISAVISKITYTIEYYKQNGTVLTDNDFVHPFVPTRTYDIESYPSGVTLPVQGQVAAPAGESFVKWITDPADESTVITSTPAIAADTPRVLRVYAVYESDPTPVTYTLHYFYNDDNQQRQNLSFNVTVQTQYPDGIPSITLPASDKIIVPACYSFGYEFDKWLVNGVQTNVITITPGMNTDINVEAVFKASEYSIDYFINLDGTNTNTPAAASGVYTVLAPIDLTTVTITNAPNAWEYEFAGWVKENGDPITNNRVELVSGQPIVDKVYAKYTPVQYEIKYYSSEDNHEMLDSEFVTPPVRYYSVATGTKALPASGITAPAGKHFVEWRTNPADAGSVITATPAITSTSGRVLNVYAVFEDNSVPTTYTVKYYYKDKDLNWVGLGIADDVYTATGTKNLPANNLVPTREFYQPFGGTWTSSDVTISGNQFTINAGSPVVINIFAEYTPVSYTVNFHDVTWKGMYNPLPTFNIENEWQIPGENEVENPVGKRFLGWKKADGTAVNELKVDASTPNPLDLYPVYETFGYTIVYKNPDGSAITLNPSSTATTAFTVDDLASIVFATSSDFTAPLGKRFDNKWLDENGNEVTSITTAHLEALGAGRIIELTAVYVNKEYTLSLDIGPGYTVGFTPPPTFTIDTIPYLPQAADGMIIHNLNYAYEFKYWKNAQGERVDVITIPEQGDTVALVAYYELIPYSVQYFEKDNPTQQVTFFNFTPVVEYDYADGEITLPGAANVVAPAKKELSHWEDAAGNRVDSLKVENGTPRELKLYAVWKYKLPEQYNVSYQDKFGTTVSFVTSVPSSYPGITQEFNLPDPNNVIINTPGYTFKEWLYNGAPVQNNKIVIDIETTPENILITADLNTKPYYVTFFDDDGISNVTWTNPSFNPPYEYNADMSTLPALPGPNDVEAELGYEFDYWVNENGQRVDFLSITADTETNLKLRAVYKEKIYTLRFINTELPYNIPTDNDVQSLSGGTFTRTFTISDIATIALPTNSEVVAPEYYDLERWEYENGTEVTLPLALPTEGDVLKLYTFWQPEKYIVTYKYSDSNLHDPSAEPDKVDDVKFKPGTGVKYEWYEHEVHITFPRKEDVIVKRGYEVLGWTVTGQQTSPFSRRRNVQLVEQITIDESLLPFIEVSLVTQEKEYTVNFTNATFNDSVETVFTVTRPLTLPANNKVVTELGWKFIEWQHNSSYVKTISLDDISDAEEAAGTVDITAKYDLKKYPLTLKNSDGTTPVYVNYNVPTFFTVQSNTMLPVKDQIKAPEEGEELDKWVDANGNRVESPLQVTAQMTEDEGITVYATYKEKEYRVNFVGVTVDPSVQTTFTKSSGTLTFPTSDKVTPELGYKFVKWLRNGAEITGISFNDLTPEEKENGVITITADCPIINYPVKFLNFDDKVTPVQFKNEHVNSVPTSFNVLSNTALPEDGWVVAPDGKELDKWVDENGTDVASPLQVTAGLTEDEGLTVYATYKDKEQKTYTVKYYYIDALDNNNWVSLGIDDVYTAQGTYSLPADSEVAERIGYTFTGRWKYLSGNEITEIVIDENSGDEICVFAIYDVNEYNVKFYDEDKVSTPNWNNYNPPKKYTIENLWTLPTENEIIAPSGKKFRYWADKDGNEVRALTVDADTPATLNLYAVYEFDGVYTIEYYFAESTPAKFVAGYTAPTKFTEATVDSVVLPTGDKLDLAGTGYNEFIEWRTDLTNPDTKVESIVLTGTTPTVIKLYAYCMTQYTVKFFEGMTNDEDFYLIGKSPVYAGGKVAAFPDISYFGDEGYAETGEVASVYENNESVYVTRPKKWWYLDENDNLVEFTADTVVNGDMNVYLLSKKFGLLFVFNSTDFPFLLSTAYNDEQRLVDSVKNLGVSGRKQLNTAIALGMMPSFYNKATDKVVDLLEKATVVKEENGKKNVQVLSATFKLSQFVKENMVNTMLKKYLQEVVNNPAELDRIFSMINVADFADQLGIDTIIAGMTDAEIVSLMKSAENRGTVINFIITDLKKTDSAMLDFVIDYVINDASFREDLIDDLIAELKNAEVTSALKSQAIAYIKSQLEDTESAFYDKFVTMVYEDLNSANSVVMEAVVAFVRTNLGANTQAGKDLRKEILTSSMLTTFLSNAKMKEKVIELILADDFINTALDNVEFRTVLVEAIMADADFIDILLASEEFHDYIVDQLHKGDGHDLAKDVEDLINDEDSAFRKHVLDIVKTSDEFKGLFTSHPALKAVVLDEFKWSQFVASDEDLLKFVFQQDGVTGTYSFITRADVEAEIAAAYNSLDIAVKYALTGTNNSYENLTEDQKQVVRNNFFGNDEVKAEILNEVKTKFNSYKADIVDKIAEGKLSEVTDAKALGLIDSLLAEYVTKYIEQQPLHTDAAIDSSIANVIEEILFNFIADLIQGVNLGNAELDAELAGMLAHVDTVKHQFVVDPTPDVVARLKVVVKDYRDTHAAQVKQVITNNYQALTDKLVVMINPEHENSVYGKVEEVLISVAETIDSSLISEYVLTLDENSLKETIRKYMKNLTVGDINKYIAAFLNASNDNVEAIKSELRAFITSSEQRATVEGLAKTYINAPENEATIRGKVSDFIDDVDESFVASNRAFIESALMSLDLSEFVDAEFVKEYVAGLDSAGKAAFADKIYNSLMSNDDYTALMKSLLNDDKIVVTKTNAQMVSAVNGVIRSFDFDKVADIINRNATIEKLVNKFGKKFVEPYYEAMLNKYCDRLDAIIAEVEAAADETYTQSMSTTLTLRVDAIEMLRKLYDKAMPKVTDKLESYGGVYYNDNIYLKYLVEHDIIGAMFDGDASLAEGDFTGYSLKSIPEYYDYLLSLLIVGDDAITWYGDREDGLSQEHYDALYNAIIGKAMYVQEQLDEILADFRENGELPDKIQSIVERVSQINSLITRFEPQINKVIDKYFAADIDPEKIANSNKVQNVLDELLAMDEPIFEIDMLYDILYKFDAKSQAALKKLIDSGKLRKAIDKFYETSAAEIIKGNATLGGNDKVKKLADIVDEIKSNGKVTSSFENVYDMLVVLAEYGIDVFKTAENEKEDIGGAYRYTEDEYTVSFGGLKLSVMRYYEGPGWIY